MKELKFKVNFRFLLFISINYFNINFVENQNYCKGDDIGYSVQCLNTPDFDIISEFKSLIQNSPNNLKDYSILNITNTSLTTLPANAFSDLTFMYIYIINAKNLTKISTKAFNGRIQGSVKKIHLSDTNLLFTDNDYDFFKAFNTIPNLYFLQISLSPNFEHIIPEYAFRLNQYSLSTLHFDGGFNISNIENFAFNGLGKLGDLDFSKINSIKHISSKAFMFDNWAHYDIDIKLNNLSLTELSFGPGDFSGYGRKMTINLAANNIKYIFVSTFRKFFFSNYWPGSTIDFNENPLQCDNAQSFLWILHQKKYLLRKLLNPKCSNGTSLWDLNYELISTSIINKTISTKTFDPTFLTQSTTPSKTTLTSINSITGNSMPNNEGRSAFVTSQNTNSTIKSVQPAQPLTPINPDFCKNWTIINAGKCIKIIDNPIGVYFNDAVQHCRDEDNSALLTIHSSDEESVITNILFNTSKVVKNVWLSLKYNNGFKWTDGSQFDYTNWMSGHPGKVPNECVQMIQMGDDPNTGTWIDTPCMRQAVAVCQKTSVTSMANIETLVNKMKVSLDLMQTQLNSVKNILFSDKWSYSKTFTENGKTKALVIPLNMTGGYAAMNFTSAVQTCNSLNSGIIQNSSIVEIKDLRKQSIFDTIMSQISLRDMRWFWLNAKRDPNDHKYHWIKTNSDVEYANWYQTTNVDNVNFDRIAVIVYYNEYFSKWFPKESYNTLNVICEVEINF